jgi:hypothetical protein
MCFGQFEFYGFKYFCSTEVPEVSDDVASIASSEEYCGHLVMKVNGTSPFQKCLETKGISPDEQYDMCI